MNKDTFLTHFGQDPESNHGVINPPVYRASTLAFSSLEDYLAALKNPYQTPYYGRLGTPTIHQLEEAITELSGAYRSILTPSGLAAVNCTLLALLKAGDHILVSDSVYGHVREFCDTALAKFGVTTTYYDPLIEKEIENLITDKTKILYLESPGSNTFECQNLDALIKTAKAHKLKIIHDATWATPLLLDNFKLGVDITIHSATKFFSGHADVMAGVIVCNEENYLPVKDSISLMGQYVSPDEAYSLTRGLRTLHLRLKQHASTSIKLAKWLKAQPEVARVLHPALTSCPGHKNFKKYYADASGLFSFVLTSEKKEALAALLDNLKLFRIGQSWGGYESLILPVYPFEYRKHSFSLESGQYIRLFPGLEDADDLIEDLQLGFTYYREVLANEQNNNDIAA